MKNTQLKTNVLFHSAFLDSLRFHNAESSATNLSGGLFVWNRMNNILGKYKIVKKKKKKKQRYTILLILNVRISFALSFV